MLLNIIMINIINQHWSRHWVYVQVQLFCFRVAVINTHRMVYLTIYLWTAYICVYIRGLVWWCIYSQTDKRSPTENPALDDIYGENDPAAPLSLCDSYIDAYSVSICSCSMDYAPDVCRHCIAYFIQYQQPSALYNTMWIIVLARCYCASV